LFPSPTPADFADLPDIFTITLPGKLTRRARRALGLTQAELALRVGADQSTVARIEASKVLQGDVIGLIFVQLGLPREWLAPPRKWPVWDFVVDPAPAAPADRAPPRDEEEETASGRAERERLDRDYAYFAAERLRIRSKRGTIEPLVFNRIQRHIHAQLEAQKAKTGKVRALILKGRLQGCSTYVGGRYYHRASRSVGQRVFILSHAEQSSRNLFEMVERFQEHCVGAPSTSVANASELRFDALDSGYTVGTAGTRGVGRSATVQLLHGSEVAYWPHAETHAAGVLQAVADEPGTEVILESTAHGVGICFTRCGATPRPAPTTTSRCSCRGSGRRNTASRSPRTPGRCRGQGSCSAPRSRTTPRSTASTTSRWRGGAARSPN
jgi:transcriptional regulator with XRE-family HTH domain